MSTTCNTFTVYGDAGPQTIVFWLNDTFVDPFAALRRAFVEYPEDIIARNEVFV